MAICSNIAQVDKLSNCERITEAPPARKPMPAARSPHDEGRPRSPLAMLWEAPIAGHAQQRQPVGSQQKPQCFSTLGSCPTPSPSQLQVAAPTSFVPPKVHSYVPARGSVDPSAPLAVAVASPVCGKCESASASICVDVVDMRAFLNQPAEYDLLDQQVRWFLSQHPDLARRHSVEFRRPGVYEIDRHEVWVEWQLGPGLVGGMPMVIDGPLRQPLLDYLQMTEKNAYYDTHSIAKTTALHNVPKEQRMTFDDKHERYPRLAAMKVAKEQARIREQAASFTSEGQEIPRRELVKKYNRNVSILGPSYCTGEDSDTEACDENCDPVPNLDAIKDARFAKRNATPAPTSPPRLPHQCVTARIPRPPMNVQTPRGIAAPGSRAPSVSSRSVQAGSRPPSVDAIRQMPADVGSSVQTCPTRRVPPWAVVAPRGVSLNGLPLIGTATPPALPFAQTSSVPATARTTATMGFPLQAAAGLSAPQSAASLRAVSPLCARPSPAQLAPSTRAASHGPRAGASMVLPRADSRTPRGVVAAGHVATQQDIATHGANRSVVPLGVACGMSNCAARVFGVPRTWSGTSLAGSGLRSFSPPRSEAAGSPPVVAAVAVPTPRWASTLGSTLPSVSSKALQVAADSADVEGESAVPTPQVARPSSLD